MSAFTFPRRLAIVARLLISAVTSAGNNRKKRKKERKPEKNQKKNDKNVPKCREYQQNSVHKKINLKRRQSDLSGYENERRVKPKSEKSPPKISEATRKYLQNRNIIKKKKHYR